MRISVFWLCLSAPAAQASGKHFLLYFEPVKMIPLIDGVPAYRANFSVVEGNGRMYTLKYSQFITKHRFEDDLESPGMNWFRLGVARRIPVRNAGSGFFFEPGVNMVHWKFTDSYYKYEFNGLQSMGYCGFQHIGKYAFASISVGGGLNLGVHKEDAIRDPDHEMPPRILSQTPIALLNRFTTFDLELSLGAVF